MSFQFGRNPFEFDLPAVAKLNEVAVDLLFKQAVTEMGKGGYFKALGRLQDTPQHVAKARAFEPRSVILKSCCVDIVVFSSHSFVS